MRIINDQLLLFIIILLSTVTAYQLYGVYRTLRLITKLTAPSELKKDELFLGRSEWYCLLELSTPEYLPMTSNMNYRYHPPRIIIDEQFHEEIIFSRSYNSLSLTRNSLQQEHMFVVPLTFYKGYVVEIYEGTELLEVKKVVKNQTIGLVEFTPSVFPYNSK